MSLKVVSCPSSSGMANSSRNVPSVPSTAIDGPDTTSPPSSWGTIPPVIRPDASTSVRPSANRW